jgi:hypothetical protein
VCDQSSNKLARFSAASANSASVSRRHLSLSLGFHDTLDGLMRMSPTNQLMGEILVVWTTKRIGHVSLPRGFGRCTLRYHLARVAGIVFLLSREFWLASQWLLAPHAAARVALDLKL